MDHPKRQVSSIIHQLTEGSPAEQQDALQTYFLPDASFTHPLCRVPSFSHISLPVVGEINSRWVIWMIYRWYKILSPRIVLDVECSEFNQQTSTLFVRIHQIFSLFFVPFYKSNVRLTTQLHLVQDPADNKYYISSQEDLYQLNEWVKFIWPGGATILWFWQCWNTFLSILGALVLAPITWLAQRREGKGELNGVKDKDRMNGVASIDSIRSITSVKSVNSVASVGSVNSVASIGSEVSVASVGAGGNGTSRRVNGFEKES